MEIETVKGFQDFLPPESIKREKVKEIIRKWFKLYGFVPLETPLIEFDDLMKNSSTDQVDQAVSDRFRLKDRGNRDLGLRYEFTFQLSRILKQNPNIKFPFRRFQIGEVFRDEPVSKGRYRQFTQCDADIIGNNSIDADAECLALFSNILNELNIKTEVKINNRKLLDSIIKSVEISNYNGVMKELDKIDKVGLDEVKSNLKKYASANQIITLFKLLEKDIKFFKENAFSGIEEIEELIETCRFYNLKIDFNPFLARGLTYYTGNIFEIVTKTNLKDISVAGGGRYDKSVGKYLGRDIPAVGISFGLERLCEVADIKIENYPKILVLSLGQDKPAISLVNKLRKNNISCIIESGKPSKVLDFANVSKIPFVVFLGEEEVGKKKLKIKNMENGKEDLLTEKELIKLIRKQV